MIEERCKAKSKCYSGTDGRCEGCNVWNIHNNMPALIDWCAKHNENVTEMVERLKKDYFYGDGEEEYSWEWMK